MSNVRYSFGDIEITATVTDDVTIATATMYVDGETVELAAYSKRNNLDKKNDKIGVDYAVGRVLQKLAKKFLNQADGLSKHADDMKLQKKYGNNKSRANRRNRAQELEVMSMLAFSGLRPSDFSEEYATDEENIERVREY